jgi:hypothetical protein
MKPVWMVRLSRWQPDTGRATNSLNVEKTRGGNLLGGPSPLGPVVIETEHPRHRLVSGVTKLLSLIFVPCLVYLMIGGVNRYLSLPESMLATANAPLPAEVAAKPLAPQEPPKSADASAAPPRQRRRMPPLRMRRHRRLRCPGQGHRLRQLSLPRRSRNS